MSTGTARIEQADEAPGEGGQEHERAEGRRDQALPEPPEPKRATVRPEALQACMPPSRWRTGAPARTAIRAAAWADLAPDWQ